MVVTLQHAGKRRGGQGQRRGRAQARHGRDRRGECLLSVHSLADCLPLECVCERGSEEKHSQENNRRINSACVRLPLPLAFGCLGRKFKRGGGQCVIPQKQASS